MEFKTQDQILGEIQNELDAKNYSVTDWESGSRNRTRWEIVSRIARELWFALEQSIKNYFVSTTEDVLLDARVAERGITRKPGKKSSGYVRFLRTSPSPIQITIPKDTLLSTKERSVFFITLEDLSIDIGATSVIGNIEAAEVGRNGDLPMNTELQESGISLVGVEKIEVVELSGGIDRETDDELRARYLEDLRNPDRGGTSNDYEKWARQVNGVSFSKCLPLARGDGTVDVLISTSSGTPSNELLDEVAAYIAERRPIGADVRIIPPETVLFDVQITIQISNGYDFETVKLKVLANVSNYIQSVPMGDVIRLTHLGKAILNAEGVSDYTLLSPISNLSLLQYQIARPGLVDIQEG